MAEIPIERKTRGGGAWKWLLALVLVVGVGIGAWFLFADRIVPVRGEPAAERTPRVEPYRAPATPAPAPTLRPDTVTDSLPAPPR